MSAVAVSAAPVGLGDVARIDFRTSRSGETATASLQRALGLQYRYQPARLAIGRSLGIATTPPAVSNFDGKAIRGETLFGLAPEDVGLWMSLIVEHAGRGPLSRRDLQDLVASHWARGAALLWDGLRGSECPVPELAAQMLRIAR